MIATGRRTIKNGKQYDHLFDRPIGKNVLTLKDAGVSDTVSLMQEVIRDTRTDTIKIAKVLQRSSVRETCKAVWDFCFNHFQYTQDARGIEQVRRPSRSWADRVNGIDCDCFTVLIGSILYNLHIPFVIRLARYTSSQFEHVYPVALDNSKKEIIIDCVVHQFDYEVNYTQKKDVEMDLEYLNGTPQEDYDESDDLLRFRNDLSIDAEDLFLDEIELEGLDGRAERLARRADRRADRRERNEAIKNLPQKERVKARLQQGLNVVNKANPATALLRAGILASMKLNLFKVASKLRFGYWNESEALRNNMDIGKYRQLKQIMSKIQKVYYGAGGNPEKLKEAILTGKGNRNRMVFGLNGLGAIELYEDEDNLSVILGSELMDEVRTPSLSGLGEVTTAAAVASASAFIATIAGLLKKLGGFFQKGTPQADQELIQENTDTQEEQKRKFSLKNLRSDVERFASKITQFKSSDSTSSNVSLSPKSSGASSMDDLSEDGGFRDEFSADSLSENALVEDVLNDKNSDPAPKGGFGTWVKENPITAGLIGLGILAGGGYAIYSSTKGKKKSLNGLPKPKSNPITRKKAVRKTKRAKPRTQAKRTTRTIKAITLK